LICLFNFLIFLAVCLNISTVINIKSLTNSNQQTQSYKFTSHIAAFLSVVLITEMLEISIQTSYDQNVQLILKSYLPVVLGTTLNTYTTKLSLSRETTLLTRPHFHCIKGGLIRRALLYNQIDMLVYFITCNNFTVRMLKCMAYELWPHWSPFMKDNTPMYFW
jgi:uncharacterized membrane protein